MIVEDESENITNWYDDEDENTILVTPGCEEGFQQYLRRNPELRDQEVHHHLRSDLVEHIWNHFGVTRDEN